MLNVMHACIHAYTHTHIPWIHKFVTATIGCGISHENVKWIGKA